MCSIIDNKSSCNIIQPLTISEVFQIQPPHDFTRIEYQLTRPDQRQEFFEASMQFLAMILQKRKISEPPKRRPSRIHNVIRQFLETVKRTKSSKINLSNDPVNNNNNNNKEMKRVRRYEASSGSPMTVSQGNETPCSPLTFLFEQMAAMRPPPRPKEMPYKLVTSSKPKTHLKPSLSKLSVIDGLSRDSDDDSQFY